MQYKLTLEGYPVLLKTRTTRRFLSEDQLPSRRTPWVYLTQNPAGRWQVLIPDPNERGSVLCVAGARTVAHVLPTLVQKAVDLGIIKRGTPSFNSALFSLGSFITYHASIDIID